MHLGLNQRSRARPEVVHVGPEPGFYSCKNNRVFVVNALKIYEVPGHFFHSAEGPHPEQIFFEEANEALSAAVAFPARTKAGKLLSQAKPK